MKLLVEDKSFDLHIHSEYSDGIEEVSDILYECKLLGINTISITDHDNMHAYREIDIKSLKDEGLEIIPGVEMTCLYKGYKIHVLGYNINYKMFGLLKKVFYKHYPGHVNKYITFYNAKKLIHILGGKVVLAHPYKYPNNGYLKGEKLVESVIKENLIDGIECFHTYHNEEEIKKLLEYSERYDLYVTGGSDYHVSNRYIRNGVVSTNFGRLDVINTKIIDEVNKFKNNKNR